MSVLTVFPQDDINTLPVNIAASVSDPGAPLVMYISGDGGWNKFSQALTGEFAKKGYPVVSLNANKFFWQKKTPDQVAAVLTTLIKNYQKLWNRKKVLLVGYSFGADVMPFAYNRLPKDVAGDVINITLLSPSPTTDFEIHFMVMLGKKGDGQSVPVSINKITDKQLVLLFGEGEDEFKNGDLTGKNIIIEKLAGGHHYDGDEVNVVNKIIQHIPKK
jgi:type IV secretory pathway VirJ component